MIIHVRRRRDKSKTQRDLKLQNFHILIKILSKFPLWEIAAEVKKMIMKNIHQKSSKEFRIHLMSAWKRKFFLSWNCQFSDEILQNAFR